MAFALKKFLNMGALIARDERARHAAKLALEKGIEIWGKRQSSRTAATGGTGARRSSADRNGCFRDGQTGDLIRFTYTDEHGLICQRMVGNWSCKGGHLTGYCLHRKQEESFAVEGIADWQHFSMQSDRR